MRRLRICMVTNMYPTEEKPHYGTFVKSQIDSIVDRGHDVTLFYIEGFRSPYEYARAIPALRKVIKNGDFDVVHAHYGLSGIVARMQSDVPVVVSFCGDDLLGTPSENGGSLTFRSRLIALACQGLSAGMDGGIVKSQGMLDRMWLAGAKSRTAVIPNGVDFGLFRPRDVLEARRELGFEPHLRYVLFPGDPAIVRKRFDLAEASVDVLEKSGIPVELLPVWGQPQDRVVTFMNACNVLLLTSDWEGSPNMVKEATACNLPVVSVDAGDAWETIEGVEGCRRAERDPISIGNALREVLGRGDRSDGREKIGNLSLDRVAERVEEVYRVCLSGRGVVQATGV